MYKIERRIFGYKLTFGGYLEKEEMARWLEDSRKKLEKSPDSFGVFVDMRNLGPLPSGSREMFREGQKLYRREGMNRSAVILSDSSTSLHFRRIARESGIYGRERYINASSNPDWESAGLKWVREGSEPESGNISRREMITPGRRRGK
ncbi:MAG: hypothetical protein GF417_07190 [Candidatus Latescibacteria bacterium]|nr:hypothetical protein [bacterium]MBD3424204.1 hypothetical protein [Candidatus Latescibacterota bacterium]